jgi:hypothetical protein
MLTSHTADPIQRIMYQSREPSMSFRVTSLDNVHVIAETLVQRSVTPRMAANTPLIQRY